MARKPAVSTKKTTQLPVKASSNGHKDSEEPIEMPSKTVNGEASKSIDLAANGTEPNISNGSPQDSNVEVQPNLNNDSDETAKTVRSQRNKPATAAKTEIVDKKEKKSTLPASKTKRQQKKDIEMETSEEVSEVQPASESESEPTSIADESKKRKAPEEEPEAVAGPSTKKRTNKRKLNSAAEEPSTSKAKNAGKEKRPLPVPKTKTKRQKVVLDIPPVRPVAGEVLVVGQNDVGQLGMDEDVEEKKRPTILELPHSFVDIAAGGMHSVCLAEQGEVFTFGCNDEGALGRLTPDDSLERKPLKVEIPEKVVQISAGDSHSAALTETGKVYIWGNFRAGDGPMGITVDGKKQMTPIRILKDIVIVKISSGTEHIACLSNDGLVYTLGCGENGQLGRLSRYNSQNRGGRRGLASFLEPAQVHIGARKILVEDVWTGSYNTFMKAQENGKIYAFGLNNYQQLGSEKENDEDNFLFTPKPVESFSDSTWLHMAGGLHHTLALDREGSVHSLGNGLYGRLGLGEGCGDKSVPTVIPTLQDEKCTDISCGNLVSFAVSEEGAVYSWGFGENYQLGHGNDEDSFLPVAIGGKFQDSWKALKVSGGGQHTLILAVPKENPKTDKKK